MITLNAEKGLIRVNDWQEIEGRPGLFLTSTVTPQTRGDHWSICISRKIRCGLSIAIRHMVAALHCRNKGRYETNIGKDCGKTHFGVEFEGAARTLTVCDRVGASVEVVLPFARRGGSGSNRRIASYRRCGLGTSTYTPLTCTLMWSPRRCG